MVETALSSIFLGFCAAISFVYNLGFSEGREILPERRDGMIISLFAAGFFLGFAFGAFMVRAAGVSAGFLRGLVLFGGCALGATASLMFGYRFFAGALTARREHNN